MYLRLHIILVLLFVAIAPILAQESKEDIEKKAHSHFRKEEFFEATPLYLRLLSLEPRNHEYNYRYGTCLLFNSEEKKQAFRYLNYAVQKPDIDPEAFYYLGKAYHLTFQFDKAIQNYQQYKTKAGNRAASRLKVDRQIEMCRNGKSLLADITETIILNKTKIDKKSFFRIYDLSDIGGEILVTEEFQTRQDKRMNHVPIIHFPANSNKIYYSSYGENGTNKDIYERTRLPDGSWSKAQPVFGNINTEYDEDFPYMSPNRRFLYFSSEGHRSMGGFDIFRSIYDEETNIFGEPENLDIPISSPDNDFLYIVDSLERYAYFSSQRASEADKVDVYQVRVERIPLQFVIIKGQFDSALNPRQKALSISITNNSGEKVGDFRTTDKGDYLINLPKGGNYIFTLKVGGKEEEYIHEVKVPYLREFRPLKQRIVETEKEGAEVVEILNLFDERFVDEEAIIAEMLELRSKMEINKDHFDLDSLDQIQEQRKVLRTVGLDKYTTLEIHDLIKEKHNTLQLRQENTEKSIQLTALKLEEINEEIATSLKNAKELLEKAKKTDDKSKQTALAKEAQSEIENALKRQEEIAGIKAVLEHLQKVQESDQKRYAEAKALDEKRQSIAINDEEQLMKIIGGHKEFSRNELRSPISTNAARDYQAELNKKNSETGQLAQNKESLERELVTLKEKIKELKEEAKTAKKRRLNEIETELSRTENDLHSVESELYYIEQQLAAQKEAEQIQGVVAQVLSSSTIPSKSVTLQPETIDEFSWKEEIRLIQNEQNNFVATNDIDLNAPLGAEDIAYENTVDSEKPTNTIEDRTFPQKEREENTTWKDEELHEEVIVEENHNQKQEESKSSTGEDIADVDSEEEIKFSTEESSLEDSQDTESENIVVEESEQEEIKEQIEETEEVEKVEEIDTEEISNLLVEIKEKQQNQTEEIRTSLTELKNSLDKKQTANVQMLALEQLALEIENKQIEYALLGSEEEKTSFLKEIEGLQNRAQISLDKAKRKQAIQNTTEEFLTDFSWEDISLSTDDIHTQQTYLREKEAEIRHIIQHNESLLPKVDKETAKEIKQKNRQFKILLDDISFQYEANERKLAEKAAEESKYTVEDIWTKNTKKSYSEEEKNQLARSSEFQAISEAHHKILELQNEIQTQEEIVEAKKEGLNEYLQNASFSTPLTPTEKESLEEKIIDIQQELKELSTQKENYLEAKKDLEQNLKNQPKATRELISELILDNYELEDDIVDLPIDDIADLDTYEEEVEKELGEEIYEEEHGKTTSFQRSKEAEFVEEKRQELLSLEEVNPSLKNNKKHQQQVTEFTKTLYEEEEKAYKDVTSQLDEMLTQSEENIIPPTYLDAQRKQVEIEQLNEQFRKEKNPTKKRKLIEKVVELQEESRLQVEQEIARQERKQLFDNVILQESYSSISSSEELQSSDFIQEQKERTDIELLKTEDLIKEREADLAKAKKKEKAGIEESITQLKTIESSLKEQQVLIEDRFVEQYKREKQLKNKGVSDFAIEHEISYDKEVELAQTDTYKELLTLNNRLHEKQYEHKVKIEKSDQAKTSLETISIDDKEEIQSTLAQINQLKEETQVIEQEISQIQQEIKSKMAIQGMESANYENLLIREVLPIKEPVMIQTLETGIFLTGQEGSYSDSNPIPIEKQEVKGLIFRVQIGAFGRPVPNNTFQEFHPITGEEVRPGLIRYMAGLFGNRQTAEQARDQIRSMGYSDAFVVAYCDGERIPVYRAVELMNSGACVPQIEVPEQDLFAASSSAPSSTPSSSTEKEIDQYAYNKAPNAAPAEAAEAKMGLYYTVQVGVYNRPVSSAQLFHISPLVTKRLPNGQIRYSSGMYNSVEEAQPKRTEAREKGVNDAFITAYYQGKRITIQEAKAILEREGDSVLELNQPTKIRGNEILNKKTPESLAEEKEAYLSKKTLTYIYRSINDFSEYPTQFLNRLNEDQMMYYFNSTSGHVYSFIQESTSTASQPYNFEKIELYQNAYEIADKEAIHLKDAVKEVENSHYQIEVKIEAISSDILDVVYNTQLYKTLQLQKNELVVNFYALETEINLSEIEILKAKLLKLGAKAVTVDSNQLKP